MSGGTERGEDPPPPGRPGGRRAGRLPATPAATFPGRVLATPLHGRLYLALQRLRGRPVRPFMRRLQRWERLEPAEFDRLHEELLRDALRYAHRRVPLYRMDRWRTALAAGAERLEAWPVLERETLRTRAADLRGLPRRPWHSTRRSSASTGPPIEVAIDGPAAAWSWANEYRAILWHGIPVGARTLKLWGYTDPLLDRIRNQTTFLTTRLTPAALEAAATFLQRRRPLLVWGPSSAVFHLARYLRELDPPPDKVPFAKVGGEQLYPFERAEIGARLAERVIESYGCTEVGAVAGECPAGSLHVFAEHVHLEILRGEDPVRRGEFGDIVLTSLFNRVMPLVRCRIGDRGRLSPEPCRCGLPHPVLVDLQARAGDVFLAADGTPLHASALVNRLEAFFGDRASAPARQVLFGQVDPLTWKVWVEGAAPGPDAPPEAAAPDTLAERLAGIVRETFGRECRVEIEPVPTIPRELSGKYRYYSPEMRGGGG